MRNKILALYIISILLGVIVGLVGSIFRLSISILGSYLTQLAHSVGGQGWGAALISGCISVILVLAAFLAVKYIAPEASGSGVHEIEGALLHVRPIFWKRLLPVKFFFGILPLAAKMVLVGRGQPFILAEIWGKCLVPC